MPVPAGGCSGQAVGLKMQKMTGSTETTGYDGVCGSDCPVSRCAEIIDGKWTTRIIRDLLSGPRRFSELRRSLDGISPKMLAQRLRFLEDKGLVSRKVYPSVPPKTEYRLTPLGAELKTVIMAMARFGERLKSENTA